MNETVRRFLPMVDFLEQILGKNSEIVLHDFSDPDHAIVDIRNGIVSGRKVGGPATDLALKIMHDAKYRDLPFITGYEGRGAGGKTLESATYFIRENDEIVGMLCVNTDLSTVRSINAMAQQLMACFDAAPTRTEPAPIEVESQRLPLPAKSPQGRLTSKMKRGSTSDPSLDKRPCSSHALQGLFACHV